MCFDFRHSYFLVFYYYFFAYYGCVCLSVCLFCLYMLWFSATVANKDIYIYKSKHFSSMIYDDNVASSVPRRMAVMHTIHIVDK